LAFTQYDGAIVLSAHVASDSVGGLLPQLWPIGKIFLRHVFTFSTSDDPDLIDMVLRLGLCSLFEKNFGITCNDMPHCMCDDRELLCPGVWLS
jgi:hypothetical protein